MSTAAALVVASSRAVSGGVTPYTLLAVTVAGDLVWLLDARQCVLRTNAWHTNLVPELKHYLCKMFVSTARKYFNVPTHQECERRLREVHSRISDIQL